MAVPGLLDGWSASETSPLRPADINFGDLRSLWDASEQDVFNSAFAPGASEQRALPEPRSREFEQSIESEIADAAWRD
jgi:hypothetical protein